MGSFLMVGAIWRFIEQSAPPNPALQLHIPLPGTEDIENNFGCHIQSAKRDKMQLDVNQKEKVNSVMRCLWILI